MASLVELPAVRLADESDRPLLARFSCALDRWYEQEVEAHIQRDAIDRLLWRRDYTEYRLLLFENDQDGLVAIGASEIGELSNQGQPLRNTYIDVIAVSLDCRRRRVDCQGQPRVGEYVLDHVIFDARNERPDDELIYASIAKENEASLALFRDRGFGDERPHEDDRYVYLLGQLG